MYIEISPSSSTIESGFETKSAFEKKIIRAEWLYRNADSNELFEM